MSSADDRLLTAAWEGFCDQLKSLGCIPYREKAPPHMIERVTGFEMLARNIALGLLVNYENNDPLSPELQHMFDPFRKQAGDNNDGIYVYAPINGTDTYRIYGDRGTADYFSIALVNAAPNPWGGQVSCILTGDEIEVDKYGQFEIVISPDSQAGQWLQSNPQSYRVMIRQFFGDWSHERPMKAHIDRISSSQRPRRDMSAERLAKGLADTATWIGESIEYFAEMIERWQARPNEYLSYRQIDGNVGNTPGGEALVHYWRLADDECQIIRVRPPEKFRYWSVEFGNYWWATMDYRYHLSSTNNTYAAIEDDGELIIVISGSDPGVPNWLDTAGYSDGYSIVRWMDADSWPVPTVQQVKVRDLYNHLPPSVKRMTARQRAEQIADRRRGSRNRFGH